MVSKPKTHCGGRLDEIRWLGLEWGCEGGQEVTRRGGGQEVAQRHKQNRNRTPPKWRYGGMCVCVSVCMQTHNKQASQMQVYMLSEMWASRHRWPENKMS